MEGKRLLERIREMARPRDDQKPPDADNLQQSILKHLNKMLNTRQGSTVIAPDYGVPDFSHLTTQPNAANLAIIEKTLHDVVTRYEPRLQNVAVQFAQDPDDPLKMSFQLTGEVADMEDTQITFQTVLTHQGRISIQRQQQ